MPPSPEPDRQPEEQSTIARPTTPDRTERPWAERPAADFLEARRALDDGDEERAAFLLDNLLKHPSEPLEGEPRLQAVLLLGDLRYRQGLYEPAFEHYLEVLELLPSSPPSITFDPAVSSRVHYRLARMSLYERRDRELARHHLLAVRPGLMDEREGRELAYLRRRLTWRELGPSDLSLTDGNVSALYADRDDLWVGTWNGGLVRHSLSSGESRVFRADRESLDPNTVRTIEVADNRVWVGTYQGLSVYFKVDGSWKVIDEFSRSRVTRVETVRRLGEELYVGTLGRGLWRLRDGFWRQVRGEALPGNFITCLESMGGRIFIGTLDLGVVVYSPGSGELTSFDRLQSGLTARNVTLLLADGPQRLWIGTYGDGLYLWEPEGGPGGEGRLQRFSRGDGRIGDDWVLSGVVTPRGTWFGTFGGGISFLDRNTGRWRIVGLRDGLPGLDISGSAAQGDRLFFGTLGTGVVVMDETLMVDDAF